MCIRDRAVLIQKRTDLHAFGFSRIQHTFQIRKRVARIDDVFHDNDMSALDLSVQILDELDLDVYKRQV